MLQPIEKGYITTASNRASHKGYQAYDIGWLSLGIIDPKILAVDDGIIKYSGYYNNGAGYWILLEIESANPNFKYLVRYVHNKKNLVKTGQKVKRGEVIAIGGKSGNASGEHLHLETWIVPKSFYFFSQPYGTTRAKYSVEPNALINFTSVTNGSNLSKPLPILNKYLETPLNDLKAVTTSNSLNMRDYPSTKSLSAGAMPKELKAVAKTSKVNGYEWIKCEYNGKYVYVASDWVKLVGACEPVIIEKEVIKYVDRIVEVEKPFKEVFEKDGLKITVEKVVVIK